MKFITEEYIDEVAGIIGELEDYESLIDDLSEGQPVLIGYLNSESFKSFTNDEHQLFLFASLVIWKVVHDHHGDIPEVSEEDMAEVEEKNWDVLDQTGKGDFRDRLTPFFEDYPQEDLLAFVEDSLVPDEDRVVSEEGREHLFISLKTIIDNFILVLR